MSDHDYSKRLKMGGYDIEGMLETPGGLIVPAKSAENLIKSEAKRLAAKQETFPSFFSKFGLFQNMRYHGARAKPMQTPSFAELFRAADASFIDSILINARKNQMKMVWRKAVTGKQVGFKVVHEQHDDPKFKPTDDIIFRCKEMETLIANPTPERFARFYPHGIIPHEPGIEDFVSRVIEAELIIDRKVMYRGKAANGKGYAFFHWLPGESIYPVHEALRRYDEKTRKPGDPARRNYDQLVVAASKTYGVDLTDKDYVQIDMAGDLIEAFTAEEISINIANPSSRMDRFGFGRSCLEISLDVTGLALSAWNYNKELFNTNYPEAFLEVVGEYDKEGLDAFKLQMSGDVGRGGNQRLPVISSTGEQSDANNFKFNLHKLRDNPKDMLWDKMIQTLVNIKCSAYGCHPTVVNFTMGGGDGGSLFGHNPVDEIEFSKEHGFLPSLLGTAGWLTRCIVKPVYDDLKLIIEGLDDSNEKEKQEIFLNKIKNYETRNEARMADGLEPEGFWLPKTDYDKLAEDDPKRKLYEANPYNYPADAPVATYLTALASKTQMEAMQQQGQPGGEEQDQGGGTEEDQYQEDDGSPWGADSGQGFNEQSNGNPMEKSRKDEVKYLRITIE